MKSVSAEIICVGTELLLGETLDTNSGVLSRALSRIGINLFFRKTVGDNHDRLVSALRDSLKNADIVITSGGLGSTCDDLTKETVCDLLELPLEMNEDVLHQIEAYYQKRNRTMTDNNRKQALIPKGAAIFPNRHGMAPGLAVEKDGKTVILLPGPPREFEPLVETEVIPYLARRFGETPLVTEEMRLYGIAESTVDTLLGDLMQGANPTLAPYAKNGEVLLRLTAKGENEAVCRSLMAPLRKEIDKRVGDFIYTDRYPNLETALLHRLKDTHRTVAFAESCTGGLCAKRLTDIAGASSVIGMSVVTYSREAKMKILGVPKEVLDRDGTISEACAAEMAKGILALSGADIGISVTGLAGPDGDEGKEAGLVYIGIAAKGSCRTERHFFPYPNDRTHVRYLASSAALYAALKTE